MTEISIDVREEVLDFLRSLPWERLSLTGDAPAWRRIVTPDVVRFTAQMDALERVGASQYAAILRDAEQPELELPTPVVVSDLHNLERSYSEALTLLDGSKIPLKQLDRQELSEVFVDRLAEFVSAFNQTGSATPKETVVNTNRAGDPVFYCLGYFTSTAAGMGTSTPARATLSSGRYSFGIDDSGTRRYGNLVWNCPNSNVRLSLP